MPIQSKRILTTSLAIAMLGSAAMLSVSFAKGPYRRANENAFDGPPVGHPDKALIATAWIAEDDAEQGHVTNQAAFDWGLESNDVCTKCGFKDSKVTPVVLDVPELLGPGDTAAIDVIKRKLGINAFRGSIFDGPESPAAQLFKQDAPPELKSFDFALEEASDCGSSNVAHSSDAQKAPVAVYAVGSTCDASGKCCNEAAGRATVFASDEVRAQAADAGECNPSNVNVAVRGVYRAVERPEPIVELRGYSTGLDEMANRLEEAELYAEADAIREAAHKLRLKARELKNGTQATASAVYPATAQPSEHQPRQPDYLPANSQPAGWQLEIGVQR